MSAGPSITAAHRDSPSAGDKAAACDPLMHQFPVNWAIYLGLAIYNRDYSEEGSSRRRCGQIVIDEFTATLEMFPLGRKERIYLTRLLNIATDLALGIRTKKQIRADRLDDALKNRDLHYTRLVKAERWQGLARLAAKLMLLSGFGYAIAKAVLSSRPDERNTALDEGWASAAFGLGFALIATYVRSWVIDRRIGGLFQTHDREAHEAHREFQRTVRREYQWAAEEAIDAWERMSGEKPRITTAALLSLMSPEPEEKDGVDLKI